MTYLQVAVLVDEDVAGFLRASVRERDAVPEH
jgi:hypothetical protein